MFSIFLFRKAFDFFSILFFPIANSDNQNEKYLIKKKTSTKYCKSFIFNTSVSQGRGMISIDLNLRENSKSDRTDLFIQLRKQEILIRLL